MRYGTILCFPKNRDRLIDHEVVEAFFTEVMTLADKQGLLSKEHFSVDGTLIQAWASHKSFVLKDRSDHEPPQGGGRNAQADWKGKPRSNDTHSSMTDPDARLYKKSNNTPAMLGYLGHILMENRSSLVVGQKYASYFYQKPLSAIDSAPQCGEFQQPAKAWWASMTEISTYYIGRAVPNNVVAEYPLLVLSFLITFKATTMGAKATPSQSAIAFPILVVAIISPFWNAGFPLAATNLLMPQEEVVSKLPQASDELISLLASAELTPDKPVVYYGNSAHMPTIVDDADF